MTVLVVIKRTPANIHSTNTVVGTPTGLGAEDGETRDDLVSGGHNGELEHHVLASETAIDRGE